MSLEGVIATNRFGLGAKPGELSQASNDPKGWLLSQLSTSVDEPRFQGLSTGAELTIDLVKRNQARMARKQGQLDPQQVKEFLMQARQTYLKEMAARFLNGFETDHPFRERLVRFWSNHFVVSIQKPQTAMFVGAFEREAIRPHVTGKFADMVLAVERHPAMLLYLDNAQSIGPDSLAGKMVGKGLNENLAREILELHTLGVEGGYTQADVIQLARILTGWSLDRPGGANAGIRPNGPIRRLLGVTPVSAGSSDSVNGFRFYPPRHEPGSKTLLGKTYAEGYEGGVKALTDIAHHPATARHIATKLATHFVADDPPAESIKRIETAFLDSGGDLKVVSAALVNDPAAWSPKQTKVRTPVEYVTAAIRIAGGPRIAALDEKSVGPIIQGARAMGEAPFSAPSPKGWPDTADAWTGSDAVLERVQWANAAAQRLTMAVDPMQVADAALGPFLTADTRTAISRAESPAQGLALLFASPEFQRR